MGTKGRYLGPGIMYEQHPYKGLFLIGRWPSSQPWTRVWCINASAFSHPGAAVLRGSARDDAIDSKRLALRIEGEPSVHDESCRGLSGLRSTDPFSELAGRVPYQGNSWIPVRWIVASILACTLYHQELCTSARHDDLQRTKAKHSARGMVIHCR